MTNEQIIANVAIGAGIYTQEEVERIIADRGELPIHSLIGWKMRSPKGYEYRVRQGEHGIECKLWKKRKKKGRESQEESSPEENPSDFFLVKTYLFTDKQIELKELEGKV